MSRGQSLYDWCIENGEYGQQLLFEFGDGNNSQQFFDEETGMFKCPLDYSRASNIKIKWTCNKGHTWHATVAHRTLNKRRCPHCFGCNMAREDNNLYTWCLNNGEWGQQLLQEFQGIDEQGNKITPTEIARGSVKKVLWKCNKGHTWYATVNSRTLLKCGCANCSSNYIVREDNNLYNWCLNNGEFGKQLLQEFQGIDEQGNKITPKEIARGSEKRVLWRCNKGHTWYATVVNRTLNKSGCSQCFRYNIVREDNNLYSWCLNNGEWGKQLLQEFQGIDEQGNKITPKEITYGSAKKVLWKCNEGHTWYTSVTHRTTNKRGCPHCFSSHIAREDNNLYTWCLNNGEFGKQLLQEFQGIDEKGNKITPTEITYGSSNRKVLWKCNKGHTWYADVYTRTVKRSGCPHCSISGTSYPEQFLYRALLQIYPKAISRGKYQGIEYDIAIPEEKICIEYSGITWHADKFSRDEMKANICKEHNVRFIQIYAHYGEIDTEDIFDKNQIIYRVSSGIDKHNQQLVYILDHILKSLGHSISEINIKKAQTDAYNVIKSFKGKRL